MNQYAKHWDYRVVSTMPGISAVYFDSSAKAELYAGQIGGRVDCYVYGYGWTRWVPAMRASEANRKFDEAAKTD